MMKLLAIGSFILVALLSIFSQAADEQKLISPQQLQAEVDRNINYLSNILSKPHLAFVPHNDKVFIDFRVDLHLYPASRSFDVFKILKAVSEDYRSILTKAALESNGRLRSEIQLEMDKIITKAEAYFARTNNEVAYQYFTRLNLYLAEESIITDKMIRQSIMTRPDSRAEEAIKRKKAADQEKENQEAREYLTFIKDVKKATGGQKDLASKVMIEAANSLKKKYYEATPGEQGARLDDMSRYGKYALSFSQEIKEEFSIHFFKRYSDLALQEAYKKNLEAAETQERAREFQRSLDLKKEELQDIQRLSDLLKEYILESLVTPAPNETYLKYKNTVVKLSFKEMVASDVSGNVWHISPNHKKHMYLVQIAEPSVDAAEAVKTITEILLHYPVYGVYFENQILIPTQLNTEKYEVKSLGRGRVLLKQRELVCSRLFS